MSKASELSGALRRIVQYRQGRTVQPGVFSTLDEVIDEAPFDNASLDQWAGYLKPGRSVSRENVVFPLKKDELKWGSIIEDIGGDQRMTKEELREFVKAERPDYHVDVSKEAYDPTGTQVAQVFEGYNPASINFEEGAVPASWLEAGKYGKLDPLDFTLTDLDRINEMAPKYGGNYGGRRRYHHTSPNSTYEESFTRMKGLDADNHHTRDTLAWSRASTHQDIPNYGRVRLVEEIQSDVHRRAAKDIWVDDVSGRVYTAEEYARKDFPDLEGITKERIGYETDDSAFELMDTHDRLKALMEEGKSIDPQSPRYLEVETEVGKLENRRDRLNMKVQDAPHKSPQEYAQLELRKQLMNAVDNGDDYLALTRGRDQIDRYKDVMKLEEKQISGMNRMYDKIYASELKKLAKRYGATVEDIEFELTIRGEDIRPEIMKQYDLTGGNHLTEHVMDGLEGGATKGDALDAVAEFREAILHIRKEMGDNINELGENADEVVKNLMEETGKMNLWIQRTFDEALADNQEALGHFQKNVTGRMETLGKDFEELYSGFELFQESGKGRAGAMTQTKSFPAIKLTPEIREKILRIGVSQFQFGGLVKPERTQKELIPSNEDLLGMSREEVARFEDIEGELSGKEKRRELLDYLHEIEEEEQSWREVPARIKSMWLSQWKTLDPETGEDIWRMPGAPIPYEAVAYGDMSMEDWNAMNEQIMSQNYPGIVDELLSVPGIPGWMAPDIFGQPPKFAQEAGERSEELRASIREKAGLDMPEGKIEHGSEMLGLMLGQIPIPAASKAKKLKEVLAPAATGFHAMARQAKALTKPFILTGKAGLEFINPTVAPRLSTYGMGAAFGTGIGMLEDAGREAEEAELRLGEMSGLEMKRQDLVHEENEGLLQELWPEWSMDEKIAGMESPMGEILWGYLDEDQQNEMQIEFEERGMLVEE